MSKHLYSREGAHCFFCGTWVPRWAGLGANEPAMDRHLHHPTEGCPSLIPHFVDRIASELFTSRDFAQIVSLINRDLLQDPPRLDRVTLLVDALRKDQLRVLQVASSDNAKAFGRATHQLSVCRALLDPNLSAKEAHECLASLVKVAQDPEAIFQRYARRSLQKLTEHPSWPLLLLEDPSLSEELQRTQLLLKLSTLTRLK